jgi:DNA-binding transcriptional MerR regulator
MPSVEDYEGLAPFSMSELVAAANAILRERPGLQIQERTVRYYVAERLLAPPRGGPKMARYDIEHLRRIVAIRNWLDEGLSLNEARRRIASEATGVRSSDPGIVSPSLATVRGASFKNFSPGTERVRRIALGRGITLEIPGDGSVREHLSRAREALESLPDNAPDAT